MGPTWFDSNLHPVNTSHCGRAAIHITVSIRWRVGGCKDSHPALDLYLLQGQPLRGEITPFFLLHVLPVACPAAVCWWHLSGCAVSANLMDTPGTTSGMALSPGGFVIMVMMPIVGFLLTRYDARYLLLFLACRCCPFPCSHMTRFTLGIDLPDCRAGARFCKRSDGPFLFVRLIQLLRLSAERKKTRGVWPNGILPGILKERGHLVCDHHTGPQNAKTSQRPDEPPHSANERFQAMLRGTAQSLMLTARTPPTPRSKRMGWSRTWCSRQANLLAYIVTFYLLGFVILAMIPPTYGSFLIEEDKIEW